MPSFVSKDGVWEPAKEKVAVTKSNGEPEIYEGPDRAAVEEIKAGNITTRHFSKDPELIGRVRQIYNMSMAEYMKAEGYDEKTSNEDFAKKLATVTTHAEPKRKAQARHRSGGMNTAGSGGNIEGDFGDFRDALSKAK